MTEEREQKQLIDYIRLQYPKAVAWSDLNGIRLPIGLATRVKSLKTHRGVPDIFLPEPRHSYFGLFLEMKKTGEKLKKKNGDWKSDHIAEQAQMIDMLRSRGYAAGFAAGFDQAKHIVDAYLGTSPLEVALFLNR